MTRRQIRCPAQFRGELIIGGPDLSEGAHQAQLTATTTTSQVVQSDPWTFYVDHGAPSQPTGLRADYDATRGLAQLSWSASTDPQLSDGSPESRVTGYEWRRQTSSGWSSWHTVVATEPGFTNAATGDSVTFQVHALDDAGNPSSDAQATVTVGAGPPPTPYTTYDDCATFTPSADEEFTCYSSNGAAAQQQQQPSGPITNAVGTICTINDSLRSNPQQAIVNDDHTWQFSANVLTGYNYTSGTQFEQAVREDARINMDGRNPQIQMMGRVARRGHRPLSATGRQLRPLDADHPDRPHEPSRKDRHRRVAAPVAGPARSRHSRHAGQRPHPS